MKKLLIINAIDNRESKTKLLSEEVLRKIDIDSKFEVEQLNLYEMDIPFLNGEQLRKRKTKNNRNVLMEQFISADRYIFIYPTWNWGLPAILKAYIDLIFESGKLFKYTKTGIKGTLDNKKALIINTTGGPVFSTFFSRIFGTTNTLYEMKKLLTIIGIKNISYVYVDKTSYKFKTENESFNLEKYLNYVQVITSKIPKNILD